MTLRVTALTACAVATAVSLALPQSAAAQDPTLVKVAYRCGNYFRITNGNTVPVTVTWDVYQTGDNGTLTVPGKWAPYAASEWFLNTPNRGSLRLKLAGKIIATKANGGKACPIQATQGSFGPLFSWWPHHACGVDACTDSSIAIHESLLPNGKVITWGRRRQGEEPVVWNPADGSFTPTPLPASDEFCSGHAQLPDGRLIVVGGHPNPPNGDGQGPNNVNLYDWQTNTWTVLPSMARGRWYPTATTLPDGRILVVAGSDTMGNVGIPEIYTANGQAVSQLTTANLIFPYYPRLFVAPNGKIFYAGENAHSMWLNMSTGAWEDGPNSTTGAQRDYGSAVMYDGKVLYMGGGSPPLAAAEVIDLNQGAAATWRAVAPMSVTRRQMNATILANGMILATAGSGNAAFAGGDPIRVIAEQFDPTPGVETWTTMASEARGRFYHNTALLLPDGRLLVSGSGEPSPGGVYTDALTRNAELYSPTYLFNPDGTPTQRPMITSTSGSGAYGSALTIQTPNAPFVKRVHLIRLGSVTHAFNAGERLVTLCNNNCGGSGTTVSVTIPANGNLAPPGYYMLFIIDAKGVPSAGKIIQLH